MAGEKQTAAEAVLKAKKDTGGRQRSTIGFPYMDLNGAIEMGMAIHAHVGLGECDDDQLAAWTNQSVKSSGFRVQVYTARTFGVLDGDGAHHKLTELGRMLVDPNRAREARSKAFLTVPLYRAVFEKYKGGVLPPAAALERDMVGLGVAEKQKDRARQVFERSAEQAGFFEHGKNRLVTPGIAQSHEGVSAPEKREADRNGGGGSEPPSSTLHPFIVGLLSELPQAGSAWPDAKRKLWLDTASSIFKMIYKGADEDGTAG